MKTRILLVLAFLTPLAGWAVDPVPMDVKLGLWETTITNQMDISSLIPPEALAKLTPEQRAKMEAAMQGRGGARTNTSKHCVTKDTINEALSSASGQQQGDELHADLRHLDQHQAGNSHGMHLGNHEDQQRRSG